MKIKVVSDLHLEFSACDITNDEECDMLILAGDIFTSQDFHDFPVVSEYQQARLGSRQLLALRYRRFLSTVSSLFPEVLYVPGNHEYYKGKWHAGNTYLQDECSKYSNVYFLEDDSIVINGIAFIGGALWTDMNKQDPLTMITIKESMNDFTLIRDDSRSFSALRPAEAVTRHRKTKKYFKKTLDEYADRQCVIISHHAPSHSSIHEKYKEDTSMNGGFVSDLDEFILDHPQIKLWVHGHTHSAFDYHIDDTRIVCNPRGYATPTHSENPDWTPNKIITL